MSIDFWLWRYADNLAVWAILALALFCYWIEIRLLLAERDAQWKQQVDSWVRVLPVLTSALPLLGLVGTVSGMMDTFHVMAAEGGMDQQTLMSGGIANALITTQLGLILSIPGILLCAYLRKCRNQWEFA